MADEKGGDAFTRRKFQWLDWLLVDDSVSHGAHRIGCLFANRLNRKKLLAWPGEEWLASVAGLKVRQVRTLVGELMKAGYLVKVSRQREGHNAEFRLGYPDGADAMMTDRGPPEKLRAKAASTGKKLPVTHRQEIACDELTSPAVLRHGTGNFSSGSQAIFLQSHRQEIAGQPSDTQPSDSNPLINNNKNEAYASTTSSDRSNSESSKPRTNKTPVRIPTDFKPSDATWEKVADLGYEPDQFEDLLERCRAWWSTQDQILVEPKSWDAVFLRHVRKLTFLDRKGKANGHARNGSGEIAKQVRDQFEVWLNVYPKRTGRGDALKAYAAAREKAGADVLLAGAERYAAERQYEDEQYTRSPAKWLEGECWDDE